MLDPTTIAQLRTLALRAGRARARSWLEAEIGSEAEGSVCVGLRDYAPGDDLRHVDWRWCARRDELLTKVYAVNLSAAAWVVLDASRSMAGAKFALARRLAMALAYVGAAGQQTVRLAIQAGHEPREWPPLARHGQVASLGSLAALQPDGARFELPSLAAALAADPQRRGPVVIISDFYGGQSLDAPLERLLAAGYRPRVVQVYDAGDRECRWLGDVELIDVETGIGRPAVVTERVAAAYRAAFARFMASVAASCRLRGVAFRQLRCDTPLSELLPWLFGLESGTS
jgi:uncharacterized protein (DUF58 family)